MRAPILVFGALSVSDLDGVFESRPDADDLESGGRSTRCRRRRRDADATLGYHLKIDTGMNRLGFRHDNLRRTLPELLASPNLELEAVYTHFGTADEPEPHAVRDSSAREFETACRDARRAGRAARACGTPPTPPRCSATRASGTTSSARACCSTASCRRRSRSTIALTPVMSLTSRVVAVKGVRVGEAVGTAARFTADRPMTLAVIPAGYADGLDRRLEDRGFVLIRGRRAPIVGAVSMDMLTVDVTDIDERRSGR